ncbi:MAG: TlpA disulfide reductase family protein [Chthoniobacter sp.]|uniref:TlpA family protein disulfide reductase n=1 Tax=Chthoniobacter sp. TaxID=2510640 RepID=UPI0032ACD261
MNRKAFLLCAALLFASLPAVQAAGPISYREIAMLLRNGEDQQFIIKDTARRKLLQPITAEEEQTLLSLRATPALIATLRDPSTLATPEAAAAYTAHLQQEKQRVLQEQQLAEQAAARARLELQRQQEQQKAQALANPAGPAPAPAGEFAGKPLTLKFTAADGSPVDVTKLRGKVVLIDFWATWCGPCMKEMPNVLAAYAKYHAKGFEIVGISLDKNKDTMLRVTAEKGMTWPQYFDGKGWNNEVSTAFHIQSIPAMWLVNKSGIVATTEAAGNLDAAIATLLAQ